MGHFGFSIIFAVICLGVAGWWGNTISGFNGAIQAIWIAAILGVMEVSLSFDNAVVNASVLKTWNAFWQKLFLTVGIVIAVFGMRLLFPLVIVSQTTDLGLLEVWDMAIKTPDVYSNNLMAHHGEVSAFGGMFLLLVFLNFVLDDGKDIHWIGWIEEKLSDLGKINAVSVFIALLVLVFSLQMVPNEQQFAVLVAGLWGILVYLGVDVISNFLESEEESDPDIGKMVKRGSIGAFLYLEVLDASFSFDGVIGAFAITKDIVIIMLGLAIGAMFVRSMTVYLVRKGTLDEFVYLEHGAHYAIGALAIIMMVSMKYHIPEVVTGMIGVAFIGISLWSSIRFRKTEKLAIQADS
jgi:hypothetical protein